MNRSSAQRHRINRVVNHARTHLGEPIDLDHMADIACLSKYHFGRVFQAHMNETPVQCLWRTRLDRAARSLVYRPDQSILDIAMECGFSGAPTLSRAFRQRFGQAPRTVRKAGTRLMAMDPYAPTTESFRPDRTPIIPSGAPWNHDDVRIEERPAMRVAYVRHVGPYWNTDGGIGRAYRTVTDWARVTGVWNDTTEVIGVCPDNSSLTPAPHCIFDACVRVSDDVPEDDTVSIQTVPGGTYAILRVDRTTQAIANGWNWLALEWLPSSAFSYELASGYELDPRNAALAPGTKPYSELCLKVLRA